MMIDIAEILGAGGAETFFGSQPGNVAALDAGDIAILGVPCATPYASTGAYAAGAPQALRKAIAPYAHDIPHMDFDVMGPTITEGAKNIKDCGDVPWSTTDHAGNRTAITEAVGKIVTAGATPIILGGDDSIPIPIYNAFADRGPFTILQIDAHIDWRNDVDGEHLGLSSNMRRASEMPQIEHIIQVGARGIGSARPSDYKDALDWGVKFIPARDVMEDGLAAALSQVPVGANLLINLDVDAMDPAIMPAVIGPAPGGLSYWQTVNLIRGAMAKASLSAFSLVEFYPDRDTNGNAALTAARVVCNVLGELSRQSVRDT